VLKGQNLPVQSEVKSFGVGGAAAQDRRQVVAVDKCDACHGWVNAHGRNRANNPQVCAVCHNPKATDWRRRQGTDATGEQSVQFPVLIHSIHSARMRHSDFVVWGFNGANAAAGGNPGAENVFAADPEGIPTTFNDCTICHANDTWKLPLNPDAQPTTVTDTKGTPTNQADDTGIASVKAVCTSCHDATDFANAALPVCNTLATVNGAPCKHSGGTGFGDDNATCYGCHQTGASADIAKFHAKH
jgi:OmcA/MtrC family decaheme c-type cytochrome